MKEMSKWLKKQMAALALATAKVENNALGQGGTDLSDGVGKIQSHKQGSLEDDLVQGRLTEQVKELRWRMYEIYERSKKYSTSINGLTLDDDGDDIYKTETKMKTPIKLSKIKVDKFDNYPLELTFDNSEVVMDVLESIGLDVNEYSDEEKEKTLFDKTITHGEISFKDLQASLKGEKSINVNRSFRPKFEIEKYTKKLNVRKINETDKLIEFYVSKYPDEYNRTSRLFLSELKRAVKKPRNSDMFDMNELEFITMNTVGYDDLLHFKYDIKSFDKVVEFDGFHVIKMFATVSVNGESLIEDYSGGKLEEKYKNKERK
jgi:hypothetical protein